MADHRRTSLLAMVAAALLGGCTGGTGGSGGSSGGASPPPPSSPATSGTYVPAAGTDPNGAVFDTYTDPKHRFHLLYPGGWNVSRANGVVRIAKLQNAILIATRPSATAPKPKGVKAALKTQLHKKTILAVEKQPRSIHLHAGAAIHVVFTKQRPASDTMPAATLRVIRYLLFHKGMVVIVSMQSPADRDNTAAYRLIADSIGWR